MAGCENGRLGPEVQRPAVLDVEGAVAHVGLAGVPLGDSLVVRLTDTAGEPLPGVAVTWRVAAGSGTVLTPVSETDARGRAMTLAVPDEGESLIEARALDAEPIRFTVEGRWAQVGRAYRGRRAYVEYRPGALPLVITAPHGGTVEPAEIPRRSAGNQNRDRQTDQLARAIADSLEARTGARPHLIVLDLHRSRVDVNREIGEAAENHPLGVQAWLEFQGLIDHARQRVTADHGAGFLVDLHGHGHAIARLELGVLIRDDQLRGSDASIDSLVGRSSLRALAERSGTPLSRLIRGADAPGSRFEGLGVPAVPSEHQRAPLPAEPFFSGGYITARWGSRDGGTIDAFQLETHFDGVRDTPENRDAFAATAARVLGDLLVDWYGTPRR